MRHLLAKDMMPPKPSVLLLETVELGELARESDSASESLASFRLLGRSSFGALERTVAPVSPRQGTRSWEWVLRYTAVAVLVP